MGRLSRRSAFRRRDGRRLWIGWMSNWEYANDVPTSPRRSALSLPRELSLRQTPDGLRLIQQPVRELEVFIVPDHHAPRLLGLEVWELRSAG